MSSNSRKAIPTVTRDLVLGEAGYRCGNPQCPNHLTVELHHIVEVAVGGDNEPWNLLPLCPYCHQLYHVGKISRIAIQQWKKRVVERNSPIDPVLAAKVFAEVKKMETATPGGFAMAAAEYNQRTCRIGVTNENSVVVTGYACFIASNLMVTAEGAVELIREVEKKVGGRAVVWSNIGLADLEPFSASSLSRSVVIKVGEFDTAHAQRVAQEMDVPFEMAFPSPLRSQIKYRSMPSLGESVGLLHWPDNSAGNRSPGEFQFERLDVAYRQDGRRAKSLTDFTLSPPTTGLQYLGSPIFSERAALVGVVTDTITFPQDPVARPVASGLLLLNPFKFDMA
jgi:hypothetical protein